MSEVPLAAHTYHRRVNVGALDLFQVNLDPIATSGIHQRLFTQARNLRHEHPTGVPAA